MAESESGQDKSEDPTDKRKREAREKGEIARSKDLNTVIVMIVGAGGLLAFGGSMAEMMMHLMRDNFTITREALMDERSMSLMLLVSGKAALASIMPLLISLAIASLIGPISLGGWLFAPGSMAPKFGRLNPLAGLKRMVSPHALVELLKSFGKFFIVLTVAVVVLSKDKKDLVAIAHEPMEMAVAHSLQLVGWSTLYMAFGLLIIAAIDVPVQLYQARQKLLMTKQEVRDEHKDNEGRPEVKGRIRQLQREMSQRRMMAAIPEADVIITNPTHYAVALKYDADKGGAPVLLAKGTDFIALKIREIAAQHQILLLESPALARSIYYSTELEEEIPAGLYLAVAQVLAYVYQIRQFQAGRGKRPDPLNDVLPIPPDLRRDS
ncbi:flagellar biosynthesis protein FlhB [Pseudomonas sp. UBA1879]|uniref:flagellar biosynthesis protein FlhB n=1 Tax=Pseudomonas sp. UBA1879 TaxID=1947305 RepID=UPI0025D48841|nr:flagellar biosynthesis protein FlhB [Pseudomonas sp. UBA1879]